jgi:hypothetical protein
LFVTCALVNLFVSRNKLLLARDRRFPSHRKRGQNGARNKFESLTLVLEINLSEL